MNNVIAVYDAATGTRLAFSALSAFFGLAPELNTSTGLYGPFLSDPRVYYDWQTQHFFVTELEIRHRSCNGRISWAFFDLDCGQRDEQPVRGMVPLPNHHHQ